MLCIKQSKNINVIVFVHLKLFLNHRFFCWSICSSMRTKSKKFSTFSKNFSHFWYMLKHVKITSKSRLKYGDIQLTC